MTDVRWSPPIPDRPPREVFLTARRVQLLKLLCQGHTNAEIGAHLYITEDTVKTTVKLILNTAGARNRTELVHLLYSGQVLVNEIVDPWRRAA